MTEPTPPVRPEGDFAARLREQHATYLQEIEEIEQRLPRLRTVVREVERLLKALDGENPASGSHARLERRPSWQGMDLRTALVAILRAEDALSISALARRLLVEGLDDALYSHYGRTSVYTTLTSPEGSKLFERVERGVYRLRSTAS